MSLVDQINSALTRIGSEFKSVRVALSSKIDAFADPNADRIVFWDDSAGAFAALTPSTGLTLTGTNLTVRAASDTLTGIVERATNAETTAGTDTTRYISPSGLAASTNAVGVLTDAATIAINVAGLTELYRVTIAGNRTLGIPSNATDGQRILLQVTASGADRTLTLPTGTAGSFMFGTEITAIPVIKAATTTYIGCIYSTAAQRWHVLAVAGGY